MVFRPEQVDPVGQQVSSSHSSVRSWPQNRSRPESPCWTQRDFCTNTHPYSCSVRRKTQMVTMFDSGVEDIVAVLDPGSVWHKGGLSWAASGPPETFTAYCLVGLPLCTLARVLRWKHKFWAIARVLLIHTADTAAVTSNIAFICFLHVRSTFSAEILSVIKALSHNIKKNHAIHIWYHHGGPLISIRFLHKWPLLGQSSGKPHFSRKCVCYPSLILLCTS